MVPNRIYLIQVIIVFLWVCCKDNSPYRNHVFVQGFMIPSGPVRQHNAMSSFESRVRFPVPSSKPVDIQNKKSVYLSPQKRTISKGTHMFMSSPEAATSTYYLVRILFLRSLAFVYGVAFLVAFRQNKALIGDNGLTPARYVLRDAKERGKLKRQRRVEWFTSQRPNFQSLNKNGTLFSLRRKILDNLQNSTICQNIREVVWDRSDKLGRPLPSLLWLPYKDTDDENSNTATTKLNPWLDAIALTGIFTSLTIFALGAANVPILALLYLCQRSLMSVGGIWYGYGWEPQLAELNFHALFLVPFLSLEKVPLFSPVSPIVVWALRWYLFRIMMGAGLIKLRSGDKKWKDFTVMNYFYETQPIPNPITKWFHQAPTWWHRFETLGNHVVELIAPWFLLSPWRGMRVQAGVLQLVFQMILISSGNLSFLNWLTMVPALFCLDDIFVKNNLGWMFSSKTIASASVAAYSSNQMKWISQIRPRNILNILFGLLIAKLSIPVVKNLCSKKQVMNASFDPLRLVNTYGAFGTVTEERIELVIETAAHFDGPWTEYQFKAKPSNVYKRPKFISPYHYRLDWQMWVAATTSNSIDRHPWMYTLLLNILRKDRGTMGLLHPTTILPSTSTNATITNTDSDNIINSNKGSSKDPSDDLQKYIRIIKYRYKFNPSNKVQRLKNDEPYWIREKIGNFFPRQGICTANMLEELINAR